MRYDGGHKLDRFLRDTLGQYVSFLPVCSEVECGLLVPRPSMRLYGSPDAPRLIVTRTGVDLTEQMLAWAKRRVVEHEKENLNGYIFKKGSYSSGMVRVKIYNKKGLSYQMGSGLFAKAFMDHFPRIPVEEEGRLYDPMLRENFIERIFALKRWHELLSKKRGLKELIEFHTCEKLLLLFHSPKHTIKIEHVRLD